MGTLLGLALTSSCSTIAPSSDNSQAPAPIANADTFDSSARAKSPPSLAEMSAEMSTSALEPMQGQSMKELHPPTIATVTLAFGNEDFELNTGSEKLSDDASAVFGTLRAEHFFESQVGVFFSADVGSSDDLDGFGTPEPVSVDTTMLYLGVSFRATVGDDFRIPVRFGPYYHEARADGGPDGETTYSTLGLKLSAEPEYVFMRRNGSELSAFLEFGVGAGPSNVEDDVDDEDGYSFTFDAELGMRYKFAGGVLIGLSLISRQQNYGATDTYNNAVFFGTNDELLAVGLTVGARW
jgi:hypothetical protein